MSDLLYRGLPAQAPPFGRAAARHDPINLALLASCTHLCSHGNQRYFSFVWGIFAALRLPTESCGTSSANAGSGRRLRSTRPGHMPGTPGELPDARMRRAASRRGYELTHRARQIREEDFGKFDLIVVMDDRNYEHVHRGWRRRVRMPPGFSVCGSFSAAIPAGIMFPIPITKGPRASSWCSTMLEDGCEGILAHLGK